MLKRQIHVKFTYPLTSNIAKKMQHPLRGMLHFYRNVDATECDFYSIMQLSAILRNYQTQHIKYQYTVMLKNRLSLIMMTFAV